MKKLQLLGEILSKTQQKAIMGGYDPYVDYCSGNCSHDIYSAVCCGFGPSVSWWNVYGANCCETVEACYATGGARIVMFPSEC